MEEVRGRTYKNGEGVKTDGTTFIDCRFEWAQLRYGGGEHPVFEDCIFGQIGWYFEDGALRTVQFLQAINGSENGKAFMDDLFQPGRYIAE